MQLKKELNLLHVFSISTGAMISSGLFVLPGLAFAKAGPSMIVAYLLAAMLIIPSMLAKAELSTAMPKAGGTYFYIERSLGPVLGTFGGFANWFSLSLKSAFALVGIGAFARLIVPDIPLMQIKLIAVSACILFTIFNLLSVKLTGRIQIALVFILIVILSLYISAGFVSTQPDRYTPFMPNGFWSVVSAAGLVFVSFGGLTKIASVAEEVRNPARNIPLGMLLSFTVVTLLYVLAISVTVGIVEGSELNGSLIPLSLGASHLLGPAGGVILGLAAITAFITTANAGILAASRSPLAMSRDRLLPKLFAGINPRFQTPHISILITSGFMILVILFLSIEELVKTASTLMIVLFIMVNISLIVMRESKIQNYQPKFRVPLYPWLPVGALFTYSFLLVKMGIIPLLISGSFFLFGLISYWGYSRLRVYRTSALMHIVERITAKELASKTLEKELKEIVIERDEIIEDRFDQLIQKCEILDLKEAEPVEHLFENISNLFSKKLEVDQKLLFERFMEREKQSGTVITPGLAIPHVIVPGQNRFEIMLVRCRDGIQFSSSPHPVYTMFVLIGSMDERNYHLRALMAIAYIAQETDFEKKWMAARNIDELRDVILLSNRKRDSV
jgi:amino acid transporter/mannitol/fructose-specific phosphotransferase system IIA component (Ntr-type)